MGVKTELMAKFMADDSISFKIVFLLSFVICFFITLFALVLPVQWRLWLPGAEGDKPFLDSVRAGVYSFMSYLN